jgi:RNA polymerase sigma-70 factor, ECF subfamily
MAMERNNSTAFVFDHQMLVCKDIMYNAGMRLTGNKDDADYLIRQTYHKAYKFREKFKQGTNFQQWLYRILKNSFIEMYRNKISE